MKTTILRSLLLLLIVGILFLHFYVPRLITEIKNPVIGLLIPKTKRVVTPDLKKNNINGEIFQYKSLDQTILKGYISYADSAIGTIILLHGIRSNCTSKFDESRWLTELGFNSVAIDLRAHNQSEGVHTTFGYKEKKDIQSLVNVIKENDKLNGKIGIWGESLGAAIALQVMAEDDRIDFGIIESTFSDFELILGDYFEDYFGTQLGFLTSYLSKRAGKIADFKPSEVKPKNSCSQISKPILMAHGTEDDKILIQYGLENFNNLNSTEKQFIKVPSAGHSNLHAIGGQEYFNKLESFLMQNIAQ